LTSVAYYGSVEEIIEIYYHGNCSIVLFKCSWFHNKIDEYGFTQVNFNKPMGREEPFILSSQARQVFYVHTRLDWENVLL